MFLATCFPPLPPSPDRKHYFKAPDLDDTTDLYGHLAELEGEEDQAMPEETPAAS